MTFEHTAKSNTGSGYVGTQRAWVGIDPECLPSSVDLGFTISLLSTYFQSCRHIYIYSLKEIDIESLNQQHLNLPLLSCGSLGWSSGLILSEKITKLPLGFFLYKAPPRLSQSWVSVKTEERVRFLHSQMKLFIKDKMLLLVVVLH